MKAWINPEHGAALQATEVEEAPLGAAGLSIAVDCCGLCHSDLHSWHGTTDLGSRGVFVRPRPEKPFAMGHEIVGTVVAVGPEVAERRVGEKVIVYPWFACGTCPACARGEDNMCANGSRSLGFANHGGFAERVVVPHERYALPLDGLDPAEAAPLACAGLTARCALRKIEATPAEERVLMIGAGGVGLTAVAVARALGRSGMIVVDRDPDKEAAALAAGAARFVALRDGMTPAEVIEAIGGKVLASLDFVSSTASASLAFECLAKGGRMVQVGLYGGELVAPLPILSLSSLTVQGSVTGSLDDFRDVVELAKAGALKPTPVTRLPRREVNRALARLDAGQVTGRLVLEADAEQEFQGGA